MGTGIAPNETFIFQTLDLALIKSSAHQIRDHAMGLPQKPAGAESTPWVLACENPIHAMAALWGLGWAGCTIILPPNHQPQSLAQFLPQAQLMNDERWLEITRSNSAPKAETPVPRLKSLDFPLEFWTSGSTGQPKCVPKCFSQLLAEVDILEALFGAAAGPGPILSTVSHTHIYGFLFRLLWPLITGRSVCAQACQDPLALQAALQAHPQSILISSPTHLSRLPCLLDLKQTPMPRCTFSSGGPLSPEDASRWPGPLVEVYGSTESGGIAWRKPGESWTPFPDYALSQDSDGALCVTGPRASLTDEKNRLRMEDAVEMRPDGCFQIQKRLDRVVKIFEKRISLPEMEKALVSHPHVAQAHVLLLESPRTMLGAALVTSGEIPEKELIASLKTHLSQNFEASTLPKRWRVLTQMPINERGKRNEGRIREILSEPISENHAAVRHDFLNRPKAW